MAGDFDDFDDLSDLTDGLDPDKDLLDANTGKVNKRKVVKAITKGALTNTISSNNIRSTLDAVAEDVNSLPDGYAPVLKDMLLTFDSANKDIEFAKKKLQAPMRDIKKMIHTNIDSAKFIPESLRNKIKDKTKADQFSAGPSVPSDDDITQATVNSIFGTELNKKLATINQLNQEVGTSIGRSQMEFAKDSAISLRQMVSYQNTVGFRYQKKSLEAQLTQVAIQKELLRITRATGVDTIESLKAIVNNTGLPDSLKVSLSEGIKAKREQEIYGAGNKLVGGAIAPLMNRASNRLNKFLQGATEKVQTAGDLSEAANSASSSTKDLSLSERIAMASAMAGKALAGVAAKTAGRLGTKAIAANKNWADKSDDILFNLENPTALGNTVARSARWAAKGTFAENFVNKRFNPNGGGNDFISAGIQEGDLDKLAQATQWNNQDHKAIVEVIPGLLSQQLQVLHAINGQSKDRQVYDYKRNRFTTLSDLGDKARSDIVGDFANAQDRDVESITAKYKQKAGKNLSKAAEKALRAFIIHSAISGKPLRMEELGRETMSDDPAVQAELQGLFTGLSDTGHVNLETGRIARAMRSGYADVQRKLNQYAATAQHDVLAKTGILDETGKFRDNQQINVTEHGDSYKNMDLRPEGVRLNRQFTTDSSNPNQRPKSGGGKSDLSWNPSWKAASKRTKFGEDDLYVKGEKDPVLTKAGFSTGHYYDSVTGKVVRSAKNLRGNIVDAGGRLVVSAAQLRDGSVDRFGKPSIDYAKVQQRLHAAGDAVQQKTQRFIKSVGVKTQHMNQTIGEQFGHARSSFGTIDLYVKGQSEPVLTARGFKAGDYFDEASGQVIRTLKDVHGNIVNARGEIVAKVSEMRAGLVDQAGVLIADQSMLLRQLGSNTTAKAMSGIRSVSEARDRLMKAGGDMVQRMKSSLDVFVRGESSPRMTKVAMDSGEYFLESNQKPVMVLQDITGPVVNKRGEMILTRADLNQGLVDGQGKRIHSSALFKTLSKAQELGKRGVMRAIKMQMGYTRGVIQKTTGLITGNLFRKASDDVYVNGEPQPRLLKVKMDAGDYVSVETGKRVFSVDEIHGPVMDTNGHVLIGFADIAKGLIGSSGRAIRVKANQMGQMAKRAIKGLFSKPSRKAAADASVDYSKKLYELTKEQTESKKRRSDDSDGDGLRDGGWRSMLKANKAGKAKKGKHGEPPKVDVSKARNPMLAIFGQMGNIIQGLPGMLKGVLGGGVTSILGGLAAIPLKLGGIFTKGIGKLLMAIGGLPFKMAGKLMGPLGKLLKGVVAAEAIKDATSSVPDVDLPDGKGKPKLGEKVGGKGAKALKGAKASNASLGKRLLGKTRKPATGVVRGTLRAVKAGASKILGINKGVLKTGLKVAGAVASFGGKRLLGMAAGAAAAAAGAPVIATIAAVAGVAYTGYKVFSFFHNRRTPSGWEKLRFLEYGINIDSGSNCSTIRELEDAILKKVKFQNGVPTFNVTMDNILSDYAGDIFDIDENDMPMRQEFARWFIQRFLPVITRWLDTLKKVNATANLGDAENLKGSQILDMLKGVGSSITQMKPDPLSVLDSPFESDKIYSNRDAVAAQIQELRKKAPKEGEPKTEAPHQRGSRVRPTEKMTAAIAASAAANRAIIHRQRGSRVSHERPPVRAVAAPQAVKAAVATATVAAATVTKAASKAFSPIFPVAGQYDIVSPYGKRVDPNTGAEFFNHGIDIQAARNTPVIAVEHGSVIRQFYTSESGRALYVRHDNGMVSRYAHLSNFAMDVQIGTEVAKGQIIGYVGDTGLNSTVHLHFEFRESTAQYSNSIDPLTLIKGDAARTVAKNEADLKKSMAEENKTPSRVAGTDTLASTALGKKAMDASKKAAETPSTRSVSTRAQNRHRSDGAVDRAALASLTSSLEKQNDTHAKAGDQRDAMLEKLDNMTAAIHALASVSGVDHDALAQAVVDKQTGRRRTPTRQVKPVVDLSK